MADSRAGTDSTSPQPEIIREAERILAAAGKHDVALRLFGGVAIALRCPSAALPALRRDYNDLDFAGLSGQREAVTALFVSLGYDPDRSFNALHGHQRLLFWDRAHDRQVDVVFDRLRMSHTFELRDRLAVDDRTMPLADLLLFKLQIVEANEKDIVDAITLLADYPIGEDDTAINAAYIARLGADDWGLCHTLERSLERVQRHPLATTPELPREPTVQAAELLHRLAAVPKTTRWKLRARVGERVRWYETPEETRG
jgi:hypothetical protein